jgi:beta-glucosidase
VATSAYQIEGAWNEDGKGPSIWDTYVHTPGTMANGDTGDVANDHYHRYKEDVALMRDIGANAYRFSISWPRIFPEGTGQPNPKGLDFYNRLVDALLAAGIEPFATLYHWDLPQALQDRYGGWRSRETAQAFGEYAGYMAEHLSDRVRHFFTINEFKSFVEGSYRGLTLNLPGETRIVSIAPGLRLSVGELNQVRHHAVLGHGLAVQAIRARRRAGTKVGPAEVIDTAVPLIETPEHIRVAEAATREYNAPYLTVMLEGRYLDSYLEAAGKDAPRFTAEDLTIIGAPLDFVGINVYLPKYFVLASDEAPGWREIAPTSSHAKTAAGATVSPEAMYWAPRFVQSLWGAREIFITENGCAQADVVADDGNIYDTDRIMYLRAYLMHLQRATSDGVPVMGYFHWSSQDNLEWTRGFGNRYGIIYVDFATLQRTPKMSAAFFRETARRNALA